MFEFSNLSSSEQRAYAIFLKMQRRTLVKKIETIDKELTDIKSYGIDIDDLPNYEWIKVYEKRG